MTPVKCFWLDDLHASRYHLRRYVTSADAKCPLPQGYHTAMSAPIGDLADDPAKNGICNSLMPQFSRMDSRWPKACACGYAFTEADVWQAFAKRLMKRADTGEVVTIEDAPPGAMWDAAWWCDKGPDGICLMVKCPGGTEWMVDGPAKNSAKPWDRTDKPPMVTARPSIMTPEWHGYLTDGVLTSC